MDFVTLTLAKKYTDKTMKDGILPETIEDAVEKYLTENPPAGGEKKWELISETEITTEDEVSLIEFDGLENYNEAILSVICPWSTGNAVTAVVKINDVQVEKDWYEFQHGSSSKYNTIKISKMQDGFYEVSLYSGTRITTDGNRFTCYSKTGMATYELPIHKIGFTLGKPLKTGGYGEACVVRCFAR